MKKRIEGEKVQRRYVSAIELMEYLAVGRSAADRLAQKAGAKKKIGKRAIYDLQMIDEYLKER